jgi:hypothetical protein
MFCNYIHVYQSYVDVGIFLVNIVNVDLLLYSYDQMAVTTYSSYLPSIIAGYSTGNIV